jgi:hypothetical protein
MILYHIILLVCRVLLEVEGNIDLCLHGDAGVANPVYFLTFCVQRSFLAQNHANPSKIDTM